MGDPRGTQEWLRLRAQVIREEPTCWLRLPGCTTFSTTADHIESVVDRPDLALVRSNLRGACTSCNRRRGRFPVERMREAVDPSPRWRCSCCGEPLAGPALAVFHEPGARAVSVDGDGGAW